MRKTVFPVETRESRHNSRNATWFPRHRNMRPLPPTASQDQLGASKITISIVQEFTRKPWRLGLGHLSEVTATSLPLGPLSGSAAPVPWDLVEFCLMASLLQSLLYILRRSPRVCISKEVRGENQRCSKSKNKDKLISLALIFNHRR